MGRGNISYSHTFHAQAAHYIHTHEPKSRKEREIQQTKSRDLEASNTHTLNNCFLLLLLLCMNVVVCRKVKEK
jgi:hypothetical protein